MAGKQFTADGDVVLEEALSYWVARVYLASRTELYRRFREHGVEITPEQWMVLVRLWQAEGVTQSELAGKTFRDLPTMSRILTVMERAELVVRKPDPDDARVRLVYLTQQGRSLRRSLVGEARRMVDSMLHGIPEEDLERTQQTLQRILANLERS